MQNDAIKRAEDMRKKARTSAGLEASTEYADKTTPQEPKRIPMPKGYLEKNTVNENNTPIPKNLFEKMQETIGGVNIDSDKALLLSLIMLLSEEQADELLIMALIYMLT